MIRTITLDGSEAKLKELTKLSKDSFAARPIWIDMVSTKQDELDMLVKEFDLHPLTSEDLSNHNSRIKIEEFNKYLFCVFYTLIRTKRTYELEEMDFIIGDEFLITKHADKIDSFRMLIDDPARLGQLMKKGPEFIMHRLLDKEIDSMFPMIESMDDQIEDIEEDVIKSPKAKQMSRILDMKRMVIRFKRSFFQQREKLSFLAKSDYQFISKRAKPYFRDIYDHAIVASDQMENLRESIGDTFDAYMSAINNNMNEVMKVLSIFATIALPMTVISGIYGTNFTNLPGSKFYMGFWVMIFIMAAFSAGMLYMFKKRSWF